MRDRRWNAAEVQAGGDGRLYLVYVGDRRRVPVAEACHGRLAPYAVVEWGPVLDARALDMLPAGARVSKDGVVHVRLADETWRREDAPDGASCASAELVAGGLVKVLSAGVSSEEMAVLAALVDSARGATVPSILTRQTVRALEESRALGVVDPSRLRSDTTRAALYEVLVNAELASTVVMMGDGHGSLLMRTNEVAAELAVEALERLGVNGLPPVVSSTQVCYCGGVENTTEDK